MIAFDVSAVKAHRTGVGTYSEHLASAIGSLGLPIALMTNRPEDLPPALASMKTLTSPQWPRWPTLAWLQLTAPRCANRAGAQLAHYTTGRAPLKGGPPFVLTVHDVLALEEPRYLSARDRLMVAPWLDRSIRRAAAIIAVSNDTAKAIARHFPALRTEVHVIPEGVALSWFDPVSAAASDAVARRYGLGGRVWLNVGAHGPRKNVPRLCEAFAAALAMSDGPRPQLVLVGPRQRKSSEVHRTISRLGLVEGRDVILTGYVPRDDLHALMATAELCVFPSLHEGFGLPVVEAMASGTACATSLRGALSETCGGTTVSFDPLEPLDIANTLTRLSQDSTLRAKLSTAGRERARMFSWDECARRTAAVYEQRIRSLTRGQN